MRVSHEPNHPAPVSGPPSGRHRGGDQWIRRARITGALAVALLAFVRCTGPRPAEPPHILLVTLDTTRVDHLGVYGYAEPTSPRLDELARAAVVYERAYSTSSWTLAAHASLFTGKFPSSHGAHADFEGSLSLGDAISGPRGFRRLRARGLAETERTLAEELRDAGYATGAVVAGPWMKSVFGLGQGFDDWDDSAVTRLAGAPAATVTEQALAWLEAHADGPFFLFLNFFDAHAPYHPPPEFRRRFASRYDGEIAYADEQLGRVFDWLRERGLWDRTMIIVTSDHGELLGEHDLHGHNRYLYEPLIRVPLIVKPAGPAVTSSREAKPFQLVDVHRLVLEAAGLTATEKAPQPVFAEVYALASQTPDGHWRAFFDGDYKFLWNSLGQHRLHDVARDPDELENLVAAEPQRAADMERALARFYASLPSPPKGESATVDAETHRALEALGYVAD